ncbi:hypothetical protein [Mucilaginibacter sp. Mucisp84]|uniref:hypothetical protein n=1 Tax=Mucilaginibacter sp. Mucisp84 TaxID=3243058 RepID=UPI0039A5EC3A
MSDFTECFIDASKQFEVIDRCNNYYETYMLISTTDYQLPRYASAMLYGFISNGDGNSYFTTGV